MLTNRRSVGSSNCGARATTSHSSRIVSRVAWSAATGAIGVLSLLLALLPVSSAQAASSKTLPKSLAKFANCPINVKSVSLCVYSSTTSTTFDIGSTTVTSSSPTTLSVGVHFNSDGVAKVVLPDNGTQALQSPAIPLPGGLLGIPGAPDSGPLEVTVTPQLVGLPKLNLGNLVSAEGVGLALPIDVLVSSPTGLLGSDCTIADSADPITLNLTTGTTSPPSPNTPITGSPGSLEGKDNGEIIISGMTLVDNSFAVPGADNCGTDGILDEILDLDKGLPSAAGNNTAILSGSSYTAPASLIRKYLG
jgi:hypothetical protein